MSSQRYAKILAVLTAISCTVVLVSNLAATKIWSLFGIPVDGGIVLFPISYIIGDLVVELYGKKTANGVIRASAVLNLVAGMVFWLVGRLPEYPSWGLQSSYDAILGFVPRVIIGSLTAYVISGFINNHVFVKIKQRTGKGLFVARALGSSAVARLFDSAIFETIAFFGVLPFKEFILQAVFAYAAGMILETVLVPITKITSSVLSKRLTMNETAPKETPLS